MANKRTRKVIKSNVTFGGLAAENDHLLSMAYFDNGDYEAVASREDRRCFVIGRTGSGKSATFQHLTEQYPEQVVTVIPENLSLPYLTNLGVIQHLLDLDVHLEPFFKSLWKHVILVEILRHRYRITSPAVKGNILTQLRERFSRDSAKLKAIDYLNEFGDKFWCETDERVRQVVESLAEKVNAEGSLNASLRWTGVKGAGGVEHSFTQETRQELTARYQRIVNEAQLPRLNEMIVILNDTILESEQHFTYLLIDDLDKEWIDGKLANTLIKCLFQAVIDMLPVKHLKILVALRTNIFRQLDYGSQSQGGQEEKFRGMALTIRWTKNDLRHLLEQRAAVATKYYDLAPSSLSQLLPKTNKTRGDALDFILSHTLMRPRDAILYLNACLRQASGKSSITWENIQSAGSTYSEERLLALRDEWKDPYLGINKVFDQFRHQPSRLNRDQLVPIFENIALLLVDPAFEGSHWLRPLCEPIWEAGVRSKTWHERHGRLLSLLYEISFIGLGKTQQGEILYSYQEPSYKLNGGIPEMNWFDVHPAFRKSLSMSEA